MTMMVAYQCFTRHREPRHNHRGMAGGTCRSDQWRSTTVKAAGAWPPGSVGRRGGTRAGGVEGTQHALAVLCPHSVAQHSSEGKARARVRRRAHRAIHTIASDILNTHSTLTSDYGKRCVRQSGSTDGPIAHLSRSRREQSDAHSASGAGVKVPGTPVTPALTAAACADDSRVLCVLCV